ncbi:MAG: hypothetical protein JWP12_2303 [Bacteroidetes bacterium]|nr:hypothetical protein [Bacteroidota bacterium]
MKKKLVFIALVFASSFAAKAQETKKEHTIKVTGTAELEIVPDEIYMSVTLKEYTKDKKKQTIEDLEKDLVNFLEKVTITDKKDIKMDNMSGYLIKIKRKNKDEQISKSYNIKFKTPQQVYQLYSVMDSLGISSAYVSKYSHSKMDEYKKQIKITAIKAAKDKAAYLLEAIGEKPGKAVSVAEKTGYVIVDDGTTDDSRRNYRYAQNSSFLSNEFSNVRMEDGGGNDASVIGDKTIKLQYDIDVEFEIQ